MPLSYTLRGQTMLFMPMPALIMIVIRLLHAVDFADNLPLAVLLLCKGEHVVE